jgi:8-oxo-dGTP pyrophosphatase MutT (NUDIX family)
LELGYGTGLNAALVAHWMEENAPESQYVYLALEKYPLRPEEESAYWDALVSVRPAALLLRNALRRAQDSHRIRILHADALDWFASDEAQKSPKFHLFLYDAFAPASQPELWTPSVWQLVYQRAAPRALWVSYCAKSSVIQGLKTAGWHPERLPGPPGKRQMLRAWTPGPGRRWVERVYGLLLWDGCVLVSRERFRGRELVKFPGGGMEPGEDAPTALKREWIEELNYPVTVGVRWGSAPHPVPSAFDPAADVLVHFYTVKPQNQRYSDVPVQPWGAPLPEGAHDVEQCSWVALDALIPDDFTFAADQAVARQLKSGWTPGGLTSYDSI